MNYLLVLLRCKLYIDIFINTGYNIFDKLYGGFYMKAMVNQETCISCGMCIDICPEVFSYNEDNKSVAIDGDIPEKSIDGAKESRDACPVDAIDIKE